jgi:hypothetical protein
MLVGEIVACEMSSHSRDGEINVSTPRLHLIAEIHILDEADTGVSLFRSTWDGSSSTKHILLAERAVSNDTHSLILSSREYTCNTPSYRGLLGDTQAVVVGCTVISSFLGEHDTSSPAGRARLTPSSCDRLTIDVVLSSLIELL